MEIKMCGEFYYRVINRNEDFFSNFNTSKENITRNNPNIDLYAGEWVKIKVNNFITHIVKPAENLDSISKLYNKSIEKIYNDNNLQSTKLFIGQILKIF